MKNGITCTISKEIEPIITTGLYSVQYGYFHYSSLIRKIGPHLHDAAPTPIKRNFFMKSLINKALKTKEKEGFRSLPFSSSKT